MPGEQPYQPGPDADERLIVGEMIHSQDSEHWDKCYEFVERRVYAKVRNIPKDSQEEIIQKIMYKVTRSLGRFRFECAFKTWLNQIIEHCIADKYRELRKEERFHVPLETSSDESGHEGEELNKAIETKSAEEVFETSDTIRNGVAALFEYASTHSHPVRNQLIIRKVILGQYTQAETARIVGCDVGVVSYVVREAQRYAREKMGHKP